MSDDNAKNDNYDAAKEIMKINNVNITKDKWRRGVLRLLDTTDNVMHGKDNTRDYKQLNLNPIKKEILDQFDNNKSCSILDNMTLEFMRRKENKELILKIIKPFEDIIAKTNKQTLESYERKASYLFVKNLGSEKSLIKIILDLKGEPSDYDTNEQLRKSLEAKEPENTPSSNSPSDDGPK